jgi:hypothetical protein
MSRMPPSYERHPASFRDPSGFLFMRGDTLYRYVSHTYAPHLEALHSSGLYDALAGTKRLVSHERVAVSDLEPPPHAVLKPQRIPFISYPYEWCFGELREAALLTLDLCETALAHDMILKDASAFNIQFVGTRPILIDTLSFEKYVPGRPWVAYRQFCEHFLGPLALMAYRDARLGRELRAHPDGLPVDLVAGLLPGRTLLRPGLALHIHLHARAGRKLADRPLARPARVSRPGLEGILASLKSAVRGLRPARGRSAWLDYADTCSYSAAATSQKRAFVAASLSSCSPRVVWDLGANTGELGDLAAQAGAYVVGFEQDPQVVEATYRRLRQSRSESVLPLIMDLADPSPGLGWASRERESLEARGPADLVLALALVHHLAIGRNVPLEAIVAWLASLGRNLVIEFVPKTDPQVRRMLSTREDIFADYTPAAFEEALRRHLCVDEAVTLADSDRRIYRCRRPA